MEISFTRYRIYRECPWKYKLLFVDDRRIPLNAKSSFGLSLHRALEAWLRGAERSLDSLHDALRGQWLTQGYPDEDTEARWYSKAERALSRFHGEEESRRARTICVEKEFVWILDANRTSSAASVPGPKGPGLGEHEVRGMIDRVDQGPDGAYEVIDYKTGPDVPTAAQVAADKQLRFYALGAKRGLGLSPAFLTVDCVAEGSRVSVPYDPAGEEALAADIRAAASGIEAGAFSPDTTFCPRCDFKKDCVYSTAR